MTSYLIGLIGSGIGPSLSPALHEREAARHGLRYVYRLIDIDGLGSAAEAVGELVAHGPAARLRRAQHHPPVQAARHPAPGRAVRATPRCWAPSTRSSSTGGRPSATTPTGPASPQSFARGLPDAPTRPRRAAGRGRRGSGGRARAAHHRRRSRSPSSTPTPRGRRRSPRRLADRFGPDRAAAADPGRAAPSCSPDADGLVTRHPHRHGARIPGCRCPPSCCTPGCGWPTSSTGRWRPSCSRTPARWAAATLDGGGMAVFQAADAFRLFTGREPDAERMLAHLADLTSPDTRAACGRGRRPARPQEDGMRTSIATVSRQRHAHREAHRDRRRRVRRCGDLRERPARLPALPEEIRARAADLGLSIDLYQPFRDFEAVPAGVLAAQPARGPSASSGVMERLGADTAAGLLQRLARRRRRRRARRRAAAPARRAGRRTRHPDRLRGAGLGPARQRVPARLADRPDGRPPQPRHLPGQLPHPVARLRPDRHRGDPRREDLLPPARRRPAAGHGRAAVEPPLPLLPRPGRLRPGRAGARTCCDAGYAGPLSLEVFNDVFRQADAGRTAVDALRSLIALEESVPRH